MKSLANILWRAGGTGADALQPTQPLSLRADQIS